MDSFRPWTTDEIAKLNSLRAKGRGYADIAYVLGRSRDAVKRQLAKERAKNKELRIQPYETDTLCWHCINAVPDPIKNTGCSWSIRLKPVEGCIMTPGTYQITECPKFIEEK